MQSVSMGSHHSEMGDLDVGVVLACDTQKLVSQSVDVSIQRVTLNVCHCLSCIVYKHSVQQDTAGFPEKLFIPYFMPFSLGWICREHLIN